MNDKVNFTELAVPGVRKLSPYLPGKPISELEREYGVSNIIKLASNENPLGASPLALEAMQAELQELELYPDGGGYALKQALSTKHGVAPDCITLGNGSNDTLVLLAEAFLMPGVEAIYSEYCFAVYPIAVEATAATAKVAQALPGNSGQPYGHDLDAMLNLISDKTRVIFIANPNNPTGTSIEKQPLRRFLDRVPENVLVVIDEAYHEYAVQMDVPDASLWLNDYPNLVISRTFSKAYGLAGIRVGYCLSAPAVAGLLNRIRQPFNVNSLAMCGAVAALQDKPFIEASVALNRAGLDQLANGFRALDLAFVPSTANFILVDCGRPATPVYEALLHKGIIVRPVGNYGLPDHLRITVGTKAQNDAVLQALADVTGRK